MLIIVSTLILSPSDSQSLSPQKSYPVPSDNPPPLTHSESTRIPMDPIVPQGSPHNFSPLFFTCGSVRLYSVCFPSPLDSSTQDHVRISSWIVLTVTSIVSVWTPTLTINNTVVCCQVSMTNLSSPTWDSWVTISGSYYLLYWHKWPPHQIILVSMCTVMVIR